ncbi:MAG: lysophospholipid acyltransferase family protein, partial [Dokdonella sp.]
VDPAQRVHVPAHGPLLVVANHPLGIQDALTLLQWLGTIRRDVRVLGNDWLAAVPAINNLVLPVDVFGNGAASRSRSIYRALQNGEALIVFPAGEVSRWKKGSIRDGEWSDGFARLAFSSRAAVLPVHIQARNSAMFYAISMLSKPLSTALLPREGTAKRSRQIGICTHAMISADELERRSNGSSRRATELVRDHVYALKQGTVGDGFKTAPLAGAERPDDIATELASAEKLAEFVDGKQIYLYTGDVDSPLMRELGRLREMTFRAVGEGSGRCRDLDAFDSNYEHLVLWDVAEQCIVGSYRLGDAGRLIGRHGIAGLYTSTLFEFSPELQPRLCQGLELGRSFVAPAYWNSRALNQLWQGIGLYLQRNPQFRYLFGAVSMPITLPREAREWIAAAHLKYFGKPGLAEARRPFVVSPQVVGIVQRACEGLDSSAALSKLKQHLDALGVSLPMLYRQYVDLVEPGGVQFLAFGDDPAFSGCVDGLVWLDLADLKQGKRARYLGNRKFDSPGEQPDRSATESKNMPATLNDDDTSIARNGTGLAP